MNKEGICLESAAKWQKKAYVFVAVCSLPASIRRTPPCYHGNCAFFPTTLNMHSYISPYMRFLFKAPSFLQITYFDDILVCVCVCDIAAFLWRTDYSMTHTAIHTLWWPHRQPIIILVAAGGFPPIGESYTRCVSRRDAAPWKLQRVSSNNDAP